MRKLLLICGLILIASNQAYSQSVICERRVSLTGDTQIIADRRCPAGYRQVGEVGGTSNGGVAEALKPLYDATSDNINSGWDNLRRTIERNQSQRNTQPQRNPAPVRRSQSTTPEVDRYNLIESRKLIIQGPDETIMATLNMNRDCSFDLVGTGFNYRRITDITRNQDGIAFRQKVGGIGMPSDLAYRLGIRHNRPLLLTYSGTFNEAGQLLGEFTLSDPSNSSQSLSITANALQADTFFPVPAACIDNSATELSSPSTTSNTPSQNNSTSNLVEDLNRLTDLFEEGLLNEEEFNAAKRRLLGL